MSRALDLAALNRAANLSATVAVQLDANASASPLTALLAKAQRHAAEALVAMADVDPEKPADIRALQTDLRCFERILDWLKEIVAEGADAGDVLDMMNREDIAEVLGLNEDEADDVHDSGLSRSED
jgi:leucyl aminopeptidase (aminopeptidase T)